MSDKSREDIEKLTRRIWPHGDRITCSREMLIDVIGEAAKASRQPVDMTAGFLVDIHRKDFTLEKALDFLRAHNDGVYKITASKHLDELVAWLLAYLQRPTTRESVDDLIAVIEKERDSVVKVYTASSPYNWCINAIKKHFGLAS